jgi:hypothetical protein
MEVNAYLDLPAGTYRFGAHSDDGYKVQVVADFNDRATPPIAGRSGGTANETYEFVVSDGGLYRFRMVWYERAGGAHVEWFSADFTPAVARTLINDPASAGAIQAYLDVTAPAVVLQSTAVLGTPFADETSAVVDSGAKTVTVPAAGDVRFYRISGASAVTFRSIQLQGANVVLTYE